MPRSRNSARPYADWHTSLIKLTLQVGHWGKSAPRHGKPLTEAERTGLRQELSHRHT